MLSFSDSSVYQSTKCFVTHGTMAHVQPRQEPTKGKPWNSILGQGFYHKVDLILPDECYELVHHKLFAHREPPIYHRVIMEPGQLLDGVFFTEYIKKGNVLMLSEGRTTEDNVFSLRDGLLTMYLDKETYERAGLVGKPHGAKGKRGLKPRWIVSYQLRDTAMLHGKKGFDRLLYACKTVLDKPVTWLFCNLSTTPTPDPLDEFTPVKLTSRPGLSPKLTVTAPSLAIPSDIIPNEDRATLEDFATETYEWLSLVRLQSPRILFGDDIDPYLSRYQIPNDAEDATTAVVRTMSWQGFLSADWVRHLLVDLLASLPSQAVFSLSATAFSTGGVAGGSSEITLLRPPNSPNQYLMWEVKGGETWS